VRPFLDKLLMWFDRVIIDCSPTNPVSDAVILSPEMDAVLLVVLAGRTPREQVERAVSLLRDTHANLVGVLANNAEAVLPEYYVGYGYYDY
jgi:Mrp family chromosome partitioning ATPase